MALDFGGQGMFKQWEADGTFARKNIQINRDNTQPILQNDGDMVLWEHGEGYIYDIFNSVIDGNKWSWEKTGDGISDITASEDTSTIGIFQEAITLNGAEWVAGTIETKAMPALADMSKVEFRAKTVIGAAWAGTHEAEIWCFGVLVIQRTTSGETDKTVKLVKMPNGSWNVYLDNIYDSNIAPLNNIIKGRIYTTGLSGAVGKYARMYEMTVGGGTFLLIKSTQRTFAIDISAF